MHKPDQAPVVLNMVGTVDRHTTVLLPLTPPQQYIRPLCRTIGKLSRITVEHIRLIKIRLSTLHRNGA